MFAEIKSAYVLGICGIGVSVECDVASYGLPSFSIVGLADNSIKESRERVRAALKNLDYNFFSHPVTINLSPADLKKDGSHFDLPVAVSILNAKGVIDKNLNDYLIAGELSLDGRIRGVNGILSMVEYAKNSSIKKVIIPKENVLEASLIPDIEVYAFDSLGEVIEYLRGEKEFEPFQRTNNEESIEALYSLDFKDVRGQYLARRAAEIAVSGIHNFIMTGTPGSGKTMIARRLPSIMPQMTLSEALETTKIHSVAGLIKNNKSLVMERPFVSPHHTASSISIIGGGAKAKPGHVSIASGGILFLDEMLEFSRSVLEVLRQPLEDREVTVARAGRTVTYPAKFMLVGAMNPCPCGYLGDNRKQCTCTPNAIERYRAKLSGPMLDRIDLISHVEAVEYKDLTSMDEGESSETIRQRVMKVHDIQKRRFKDENILFNSQMTEGMIRKYCVLEDDAVKILETIVQKYNISARAYSKILKTSRTIADMSGLDKISRSCILEAYQMKINDSVN